MNAIATALITIGLSLVFASLWAAFYTPWPYPLALAGTLLIVLVWAAAGINYLKGHEHAPDA